MAVAPCVEISLSMIESFFLTIGASMVPDAFVKNPSNKARYRFILHLPN